MRRLTETYTFGPLVVKYPTILGGAMPDSVVHFEVVANNLKRAQEFYSKAFGWTMSPMPQFDYVMVGTTESDKDGTPTKPGAINGGMMKGRRPMRAQYSRSASRT